MLNGFLQEKEMHECDYSVELTVTADYRAVTGELSQVKSSLERELLLNHERNNDRE